MKSGLRERLPDLIRPAAGLGELGPEAGRALGTAAADRDMRALKAAAIRWRRRPASALQSLESCAARPAAWHWLRGYALDRLGRASEADEAAHEAMALFSELAPEPLLGAQAEREADRRRVTEATLRLLDRRVSAGGRRLVWALASRAGVLREPLFNRYAEAAADLERAVQLEPKRGWLWAHYGRALEGTGEGKAAEDALERAVGLSPRSGWIRAWRGQLRLKRGGEKALEDLDAALALDPAYPFTRAWRGAALRKRGRLEEAERELAVAAILLPCYEFTHGELFFVRKALGRPEAAKDAAQAYERDPKRGWCRREDPAAREAALRELKSLRRRAPRDPYLKAWEIWVGLGGGRQRAAADEPSAREPAFLRAARAEAALRAGRLAQAIRLYRAAARLRRAAPYVGGLGEACLADGRYEEASSAFAEALRLYPQSAPYLKGQACALGSMGRIREALSRIALALRLVPDDPDALGRKAELEFLSGRPTEALALLKSSGWQAPPPLPLTSPSARAWSSVLRGRRLLSEGRRDEALKVLQEAGV